MITLYRDQKRRQGRRQKYLLSKRRIETKKLHPWSADALKHLYNVQSYAVHMIAVHCTLGCFINNTLQKKKMQYQYAPLTGVYKPDLKEFFS